MSYANRVLFSLAPDLMHHVFVILRDDSLHPELLPVLMEFLSNFLLNSQDLDDDFIVSQL